MNPKEALEVAVKIAGGQAALARKIGGKVRQGHVWNWLNSPRGVPAERCADVEMAVDGKVTRIDLRPDVFGESRKAA